MSSNDHGLLQSDSSDASDADSRSLTNDDEPDVPYTLFTPTSTRYTITLVLGLSVLSSPLTATMYFPLLPLLARHFAVSLQSINLTITVYVIFQALSPIVLGSYSDTLGRRPLYLVTFSIFFAASLGLALNQVSYVSLIVLRAFQSLGASSVLSLVYGTVADICPSSERGKLLGPVMAAGNLGTAIGPVIGGSIAYSSGNFWWAFWVLAIFSGGLLAIFAFVMPETARTLVGNGSRSEDISRLQFWDRAIVELPRQKWPGGTQPPRSRQFAFQSPLKCLKIMRHPGTLLNLYIVGSFYALWYTIQASIPSTFTSAPYSFNELQLGLAYLPGASGVILCMYLTGKVMDHNYRVIADRHNISSSDGKTATDLSVFPIERARSRFCMPLLLLSILCTSGYGWSIDTRTHVSIPLLLQFSIGFLATWITNNFNTLLIDVYPDAPSTASTAGNVWRCGLSAAAVATIDPLFKRIGRGWFYTIMGFLTGALGMIAVWVLNEKGMEWRNERNMREFRRKLNGQGNERSSSRTLDVDDVRDDESEDQIDQSSDSELLPKHRRVGPT